MREINHYDHVERIGKYFSQFLGLKYDISENLSCDGDKVYQYRKIFERNNVKFEDGVMIYMLSNVAPYSKTVRDTDNGWVSVEEWLIEKCNDIKIIQAIDYANKYERNHHLIMLSEKLNELRDKEEGYAELHDFKNNFPKLVSENFYSESVYDCDGRNSTNYIINVKNCDYGGFSIALNSSNQIRFSDGDENYSNFFKHNNCKYGYLEEMLGGYIIDQRTQNCQLEQFIAMKLGIGTRFISAYLSNYSQIYDLYEYNENGIYLMFIDEVTKKVTIHNLSDSFINLINNHMYSDQMKFKFIKELAK